MSRTDAEINLKSSEIFQLGDFTFSLKTKELKNRTGKSVGLRSQSADVLVHLCEKAGQVVGKESLIEDVWPDTFVTDDSLIQCVADIRRAIGDSDHKVVQTLPKKGYKLIAEPAEAVSTHGAPLPSTDEAATTTSRRPLFASLLVLITVAAIGWYTFQGARTDTNEPFDGVPTIAVLPFDDFSAGADKGYLSDAIAEGIITELARSKLFKVIARNSSFRYREASTDVRTIGKELGSEYILEGSQQKNGAKLRVTVQLIDAVSGEHLWVHTYDQEIGDLFGVQDQIIRTVADRIGYRIERPVPGSNPNKVSALHYHLAGLAFIRSGFNEENNAKLFELNQLAIEADPDAQYGYVGAAHYYRHAAMFGWHGLDRDKALQDGFASARKALAIAPDDSEVHYVLARLYSETGDVDAALASYAKAIELNPSASNYLVGSTTTLLYLGRTDEAIARLKTAMGIDPFHPDWYHWQMGWALWEKDNCKGALAAMQRMNKISKGAHRMLSGIYACLGEVQKAREAYKVFYSDAKEPTISEQREEWKDTWTAQGSLDRWLDHMRVAGMKE
jgi:TolB-like protein/DNA-binding winged helix-turn-helix (wHTH) protein